MNLSLSYSLGRSMVYTRGDADALAYIAAVEATGTSVSATQASAINTFYLAAKADSYYTSLKRLYLPIWGVAAANAIDMISLTSGTFNGGVTHSAGYIKGNGTTGYFDFGISPSSVGLTNSSSAIGCLIYINPSVANGWAMGVTNTPTNIGIAEAATLMQNWSYASSSGANVTAIPINGIFINSRTSTILHKAHRRITAGFSSVTGSATAAAAGPITGSMTAMCRKDASPLSFSTATLGAYFMGTGQSDAVATSFSNQLKTLWESCTGNVLP